MTHIPEPLTFPSEPDGWIPFLHHQIDDNLGRAREILAGVASGGVSGTEAVLEQWNRADAAIARAGSLASVVSETHPDTEVRAFAESRIASVDALVTARGLDRELYEAVRSLDPQEIGDDAGATRLLERILRDFRRAGVDRDEETRETLRGLAERSTKLGLEFARNIREGRRSIAVAPETLAGLPQDFLDDHPAGEDGMVTLTTAYPDVLPVRTFARDRETRLALTREFLNVGWPDNAAVLRELLAVRHQRATMLGYADWASMDAEVKMIGTGRAIAEFIDRLDALTEEPARRDVSELLDLLRRDDPAATGVTPADSVYYTEAVKRDRFRVDAQEVRRYFRFPAVRDGLLEVTGALFGLEYVPVEVPTWHEDVDVYDVADAHTHERLGRIYLDLHPREGKYNHAAQFDVSTGETGVSLPEGALVCNLPRGLMDHDDVVTLFHEFGHLVHHVTGGHQRWVAFSGVATEWDFVEAPSQLLEEWAWDPAVLATFATDEVGRAIPEDLARRMRAAEGFGRGAFVRRQTNFTALSYRLHAEPGADIEEVQAECDRHFGPFEAIPGTHQYAGFGHLEGYSSAYYTYMWSLVIAKDLFSAFDPAHLLDPGLGQRYRRTVLEPGGTRDAADLVEDFLGRPYSYEAFETWVGERGE